jgi:hypothetical protein
MIHKTVYIKTNDPTTRTPPEVNADILEGKAIPAPLVAPIELILFNPVKGH